MKGRPAGFLLFVAATVSQCLLVPTGLGSGRQVSGNLSLGFATGPPQGSSPPSQKPSLPCCLLLLSGLQMPSLNRVHGCYPGSVRLEMASYHAAMPGVAESAGQ